MLALAIVFAFTFIVSLLLFKITDLIIPMRVREDKEKIGLDLTQHNEQLI